MSIKFTSDISKKKIKRKTKKFINKCSNTIYNMLNYKNLFIYTEHNSKLTLPNACEKCHKREAVSDTHGTIIEGIDNIGKKLCICCRFEMALNILNEDI